MSDQRWPRLALFAGLAASQISLFGRFGGTLADGLLATVIWLAAGLLLFQRHSIKKMLVNLLKMKMSQPEMITIFLIKNTKLI